MSAANDDAVPQASYPYFWHAKSDVTLQEFLTKYKPSMVQNDGSKPWLWVEKGESKWDADTQKASQEAAVLLEEVTERVENIKNDDSIPVRANKKKGLKSKKELREEVQAEASEKLKDISVRYGWISGKWLIFTPPDKVDLIWSSLTTSLVEGPLAPTCAYLAKVSTCPREETPNYQHVMCLYMPDVYNRDQVTEVMKVLLRHHGMNLMGVKSNLYTDIGLDSKHPSGIQSTVWKNSALMKDTEIKALKDEYYAEVNAARATNAGKAATEKVTADSSSDMKLKAKLKKKPVKTDIFGSDDEIKEPSSKVEDNADESAACKSVANEDSDDDEEARKQALKAKKSAPLGGQSSNRKRAKSESDEDDEASRPTKTTKKAGGK